MINFILHQLKGAYIMTKTSKTIIGILITEAALAAYFFYAQPLCEPCLPYGPCPPCISEEQIITCWIGVWIALVTIAYLLFTKVRWKKKAL